MQGTPAVFEQTSQASQRLRPAHQSYYHQSNSTCVPSALISNLAPIPWGKVNDATCAPSGFWLGLCSVPSPAAYMNSSLDKEEIKLVATIARATLGYPILAKLDSHFLDTCLISPYLVDGLTNTTMV
ncbi:unnamed protein product [Periconia digitata]|uniref:Uncharacterized protein n=1 Tax=Periconia digitata TaxID=1303443 RepID=A0A9W4UBR7_9PLEO|nr:unnamed protein product [Periconia digitata]